MAGSMTNSVGRRGTSNTSREDSGSPLEGESIDEQDFADRRVRNRKSGGFLLDSTFPAGPTIRQHRISTHSGDTKGKRSSRHSHHSNIGGNSSRIHATQGGFPHSSPLSREVVADGVMPGTRAKTNFLDGQNDGGLNIMKTRRAVHEEPTLENDATSRPMIDPNQIVNMALNLSESRRRHFSAGQLVLPQSAEPRRLTSVGQQDRNSKQASAGGSLRQYLNEQRRLSRNVSPVGGMGSPSVSRYISNPAQRVLSMSVQGQIPSAGTIDRRDKARAYIELKMEYLRLLDTLPPLKPDASAPGNFIFTANNVPGSPHAHLTRTPSHAGKKFDLGRAYNPLQYIRNRRSRARERVTLDHGPEEFSDVEHVRDWVDRVVQVSQSPVYRQQDAVLLPQVHERHETVEAPTKPSRPKMGWVFTPEELLADAHWLEQGDNKTLIEDRHGRKIFPASEPQKPDFLQPRPSKEYSEKRRKSWVDGLPGVAVTESPTADESDPSSERGRKRRLLPAFRSESPKHKKHWRASKVQSGNHSDTSESETDSHRHQSQKPRRIVDANSNTGPLELRIKEIMEQEAAGANSHTPIISPDTPDKWGTGHHELPESKLGRGSLDLPTPQNGSIKGDPSHSELKPLPHNRMISRISLDSTREPRSSLEGLDSTAPSTPLHPRMFPHTGSDLSPPPSRGGSVRKSKKSRFDIFRSDESTKNNKHDTETINTDRHNNSRQTSEEVHDNGGLGTAILAAPGAVKSLLTHRKNESVHSLQSPDGHRKDNRDSKDFKEPPSAVTRFFKGVKNEGSKVGEFIFRRDRLADESDTESITNTRLTEESDLDEGHEKENKQPQSKLTRTMTSTTIGSSKAAGKGRYHIDLPSFRSTNHNDEDDSQLSDSYISDDHVSRQARARADDRSPRFNRLAPPKMDLRSISVTSLEVSNDLRMSKILARPGGVGQAGLPITALAHPSDSGVAGRHRSVSRPKLEQRHWSITDENGNVLHRRTGKAISQVDIARIRALFLCSGVKAREISLRAQEKRADPPKFLKRAAEANNAYLIPIPKKEEHVLAARFLVQNLEASTEALHTSAQEFREVTMKELVSRINNLKTRVESDLFPRLHNSGDEAVRITSEVSGTAPLTVKQVNDEIDKMLRMRRRRVRWTGRTVWTLLEWSILTFFWLLWLVVVISRFVGRVFGTGWAVVKWLLWL